MDRLFRKALLHSRSPKVLSSSVSEVAAPAPALTSHPCIGVGVGDFMAFKSTDWRLHI